MTIRSLIDSQASSLLIDTDAFAETVTRRKGGKCTRSVNQTAVVFWESPEVERGRGKGTLYASSMELASANPVEEGDSYLINSIVYEVVTVGRAVHGLKNVTLRRMDSERTEARVSRNLK